MSRCSYDYSSEIPENDKSILELCKPTIQEALLNKSIFWNVVKDSRGRSHYRGDSYSNRGECYIQLTISDIEPLDMDLLKKKIINGDFTEREIL